MSDGGSGEGNQTGDDGGGSALLLVVNVVMALIAGLLFGNLLVPTRKNL